MTHAFTPATERALAVARRFSPGGSLGLPETLLGLLSETECLAASLLAERQIDPAAVLSRFPGLVERPDDEATNGLPLSPALRMAISAVQGQCLDLPGELATEHLLLGMLLVENEVAHWLAERGFDAAQLERRVRQRYRPTATADPTDADYPLPDVEAVEAPSTSRGMNTPGSPTTAVDHDSTIGLSPPVSLPHHAAAAQLSAWRAIDASANRAREGLRVVEDCIRFALDDRHLTGQLKQLRHDLSRVLQDLPHDRLHAARDTPGDVGTQINTAAERSRVDMASIVAANFSRTAEALRSLEEFSKFVWPNRSATFEQLRYRLYTLERAVGITQSSIERLGQVQLYVLVDGHRSSADCEALARRLVAAGVDALQLRAKDLDDRQLLERARRLREATAGTPTLLIVNDRPDIALLAAADGVHLGQEDMTVRDARRILGPDPLVGVSTHSIEQARQAVIDGANYIGVGPTFPSETKSFAAFPGIELLSVVAREIRLPAFAIGGINRDNLPLVLATGITRIAVSSAVCAAADPPAVVGELLAMLRAASGAP